MPAGNYPAGTIRYVNYTGADEKTYTKKQKYYWLKLSITNDGTWSGFASIYKETWVTGSARNPPYTYYTKDYSNKFKLDYLPDASIKLTDTSFLAYVKENTFYADYYTFVEIDKIVNNLYDNSYQNEGIQEAIDELPEGQQFNGNVEVEFAVGEKYVFGWAELTKKSDAELTESPPSALDKDWTLEEVEEKIKDLQLWSDNNLLPPIFGPTNCVYFPSDLGNTEPDKPGDQNPVIKSYPIRGFISQLSGQNYEFYGMDYPISNSFQQIKCQKDETFTINCNFPFITTRERFDLIQDNYTFESDEGPAGSAPSNKTYFTPQSFKQNQIVEIRFIEQQDAEDTKLIRQQKFNQYKMQAIITQVNLPTEKSETTENIFKKYSITFKFLNDLGLTEEQYFNAKVVLTGQPVTNYEQNETYCIKRYYKKDLGVGPRLGGSVMLSNNNATDGEYKFNGLYTFSTVLKDDERLNKPYENTSLIGNYRLLVEGSGVTHYVLSRSFTKDDLGGKFESLSGDYGQLVQYEDKQYLENYPSYLIKNLDEHDYEYYQNLKKASPLGGLYNFRESNENADITFGSYS